MSVSETVSFLKVDDGVCPVLQNFITNIRDTVFCCCFCFVFVNSDVVLLAVALVFAHSLRLKRDWFKKPECCKEKLKGSL